MWVIFIMTCNSLHVSVICIFILACNTLHVHLIFILAYNTLYIMCVIFILICNSLNVCYIHTDLQLITCDCYMYIHTDLQLTTYECYMYIHIGLQLTSLVVVLSLSIWGAVSLSPTHAVCVKPKTFKIGFDCSYAKSMAFRRENHWSFGYDLKNGGPVSQ